MVEKSRRVEDKKVSNDNSCCSTSSCCGTNNPIRRSTRKIGRNEPCPCGSRQKFKKCCG